jgi:hypothetical protein
MSDEKDLQFRRRLSRRTLLVTASAALICAPAVARGVAVENTAAQLAKFTAEERETILVAAQREGLDEALRHARFILGQVRTIYGELWGRTPAEEKAILRVAKDGPITIDVLREAGVEDRG